jgi:hypothetical protein
MLTTVVIVACDNFIVVSEKQSISLSVIIIEIVYDDLKIVIEPYY